MKLNIRLKKRTGYAMVIVLLFCAIGLMLLATTLNRANGNSALTSRRNAYYDAMEASEAATEKVKKDFHVFAQERTGKPGEAYGVDHSAQVYVVDRTGRMRLLWQPGTTPAVMASDLRILLNS